MNTFLTLIKALGTLFTAKDMASKDKYNKTLIASRGSMTDFIGDMIVEPTFIFSENATRSPAHQDMIDLNLNMFCSLYAASLMKLIEQDGLDAKSSLEVLSSKGRGVMKNLDVINAVAESDLEMGSPELLALTEKLFGDGTLTEVAEDELVSRDGKLDKEPALIAKHFILKATVTGELKSDGTSVNRTISIPIMVNADIRTATSQEIEFYSNVNEKTTSSFARKHKYRSGKISASEYYLSLDIIKEYGAKIKASESSIVRDLEDRKRKAILNNSESPIGLGREFGALIISSSEKALVESTAKFRLNNFNDRNDFLYSIASFNLCVVDDDYEVATVYTSNIKREARIPFNKLKKKDDSNVMKTLLDSITGSNKIRL